MGLTSRLFDLIRPERALVLPDVFGDPFTSPWFNFGGHLYPLGLNQTMPNSKQEEIEQTFEGYVRQAHLSNGIIFACAIAHVRLFSQARFQWQRMSGGRPGDLFGTKELGILEKPEPNTVTGDLLTRASIDADYGGNYFATRRNDRIKRMRPTWVDIMLGSDQDPDVTAQDLDAEVLGYVYWPGGKRRGGTPVPLLASEVCHYAPLPDPLASYRGMSWVTPIAREIMGDSAMTASKLAFFENGMTPNLVIKRSDPLARDAFDQWVAMVKAGHQGIANKFKTLFLDSGADATVIGANMQEMEYKLTQAAGEVRIAAAAGVHPVILGISESLQGAALNAGNFSAARRLYADMWARPSWANLAGSMETLVPAPSGARLWYDDRDIPFLAEDQKDAADIQQVKAQSIRHLIDGGFKADDVVKAVEANDMGLLVGKHTGLFSVQLQAPGSTKMPAGEAPGESPVGSGTAPEVIPKGAESTKPVGAVGPTNGKASRKRRGDRRSETRLYRTMAEHNTGVTFESGSFQLNPPNVAINAPVTIEEGAVQVTTPEIRIDSPITVEPAQLTIAEGAIRSETTIEPTQVTIEEGAVRIDSPITVERTEVTIAEGAIRSETTIEPTQVTIEKGSVQIDSPITVERSDITVEPAQITVEAPPPAQVTVNMPEQRRVVKDITHDKTGRITKVVETPEEG